jgi:hypothetical protein
MATAPVPSRLVLRLWSIDVNLSGVAPTAVWIGSVVEEQLARHLSLVTSATIGHNMNVGRDALVAKFPNGKLATRSDEGGHAD